MTKAFKDHDVSKEGGAAVGIEILKSGKLAEFNQSLQIIISKDEIPRNNNYYARIEESKDRPYQRKG